MKIMIMDKTDRPKNLKRQGDQIIIGVQDGLWDFVVTQRMAFDLSNNKQLKLPYPKFFWYLFMKQKSPSNVKKVLILTLAYPILLKSVNARWWYILFCSKNYLKLLS